MNKEKIPTSEGRELFLHELAYVDTMSELLAKESGIDAEWIKSILIKTFPIAGIGIHATSVKGARTFISGKNPGRFLYCFKPCLLEAMSWLDKDQVVELFSGDIQHLKILEERYNSVINEVPFVSFEDLVPVAKRFKNYLEQEFKTIIEIGSIQGNRRFENYYLESTFTQSFSYLYRRLKKLTKEDYLERHKKFEEGLLSDRFLEKLVGPEYYREYGEIITAFDYLDPKKDQDKKALKWETSLARLEAYLEANKLKVPANLKKRDELLRANLYKFSQDALDIFINAHRDHKHGTVLRDVWVLVRSMPYEQLDLIFNGNLSYFGISGHDHDDPSLYTYGRTLLEKILTAAALDDQSIQSNSITEIKKSINDVIEDFIDPDSNELQPITYSVYQAIYLCNYESVKSACGELASAKEKLNELQAVIKKGTKHTLKVSFNRLEEIRRDIMRFEYLNSLGIEVGIPVGSPAELPPIKESFFIGEYEGFRSRNLKYPQFKFGVGYKSKAMQLLHEAYKSGAFGVPTSRLMSELYSEARIAAFKKRKSYWNLFNDVFESTDPAVIYGMIRRGEEIKGENTYTLDFSFEDRDPEEQIKKLKQDKDRAKEGRKKPKKKSNEPHPWKTSISGKIKKSQKKKTSTDTSYMLDRYPDDDSDDN